MNRFSNDREALDFVASRIADEAQRDGTPLSEVEREMLYFSETAWSLPNIMDVSDKFDSEYDQDEYEKKIVQLIKKIVSRDRKEQPAELEAWREAVRQLSKNDRYLLVMVDQAGLGSTFRAARQPRPRGDSWKLLATGVLVVAYFLGFSLIMIRLEPYLGRYASSSKDFGGFSIWAAAFVAMILYGLIRLVLGARRVDAMTDRVFGWMFGTSKIDR